MVRGAMRNLKWLVVVDIFETETAQVWKEPGLDPKSSQTEVFFVPAAPAAEKDGSLTNTMRLVQWHQKAVESPGDARSDAAFIVDLGNRLKKLYAESKEKKDRPILDLVWDYKPEGPKQEPNIELVLREINGFATRDITDKDGNYKIENVPTGTKLKIVVWHEPDEYITPKAGEEIEVTAETTKDFVIPAAKVK